MTENSNTKRALSTTEVEKKIYKLKFSNWLRRVIKMCPAIKLAESRTHKVKGRIKFLTVSIITIKGHRGKGVLKGTKWASIFSGDIVQPLIIKFSQNGIEKYKEIEI